MDLAAGEIRLTGPQTKNKKSRTLPIYGEMRHWIELQLEELDQTFPECPWLFHYHNKPLGAHLGGWKKACEEVGLPELRFHDLRHTAASLMVNRGVDLYVVGNVLGHSSAETTKRYAHLVLDRQRGNRVCSCHVKDLAKNGEAAVLAVQNTTIIVQTDKKLIGRAVGIATPFGHRDRGSRIWYAPKGYAAPRR